MKKYFIAILFIVYSSVANNNLDNLLDYALEETQKNKLNEIFKVAFKSYNEGLYDITEAKCKKFLKLSSKTNPKRKYILELLSNVYFRTKNVWSMKHIVLDKLYKERNYIPLDFQKKIFVNGYNLLLLKNKNVSKIKAKFSYLFKRKKPFKLPKKLEKFTPWVNIFPYKGKRVFGENKIYFAKKNLTFYEIGYITDTGYDELREANPLLNPFYIKKGMAIFIPRKRLIPAKKPKLNEIYINLTEKRLFYLIEVDKKRYIITFPIGIGTDDNKSPIGKFTISEKRENPSWYVPKNIKEENPDLPDVVPPGKDNPLGTRAMRLDASTYLIHGTSKNFGVGLKVSHGCIRLFNRDVERLYELVDVGTKVNIYEKHVKIDKKDKLIEIHGRKKEIKNIKPMFNIDKYFWEYIKKEKRGSAFVLELLP